MDWPLAALLSLVLQLVAGAMLTALALLLAWWRLARLDARVRAGRMTGRAAFHQFRLMRVYCALLVLLPLLLLTFPQTFDTPLLASQLSVPLQGIVAACSVLGTAALLSLLMAWLLVPRAWTRLIGTPFDTPAFVAAVARTSLLGYVPLLLFVVLLCLVYQIGLPALRWLLPLAAAGWVLLASLNTSQLRTWMTGAVPIAHTAYADQEPRIREWARLAGVSLHAILVDSIADGNADNALVAGPRQPTMFLGAEMLAHTDWRQRDAVIGHELGHARMGHLVTNTLVAILRILIVTIVVVGLLPAFQSFFASTTGSAADSADPLSLLLGVAAPLLLIFAMIIISVLSQLDRRRRHRMELDCDRFSVALTGDPLAMAVLLHTITVLAGLPLRQRSQTHPTFSQRVEAMLRLLYQPGPRARWAFRPVPSDIPFGTPPYTYTVPMDQAPQAPAPRRAQMQPAAYPVQAPVPVPPQPTPYAPAPGYWPAPGYAPYAPYTPHPAGYAVAYPYPYPYAYPYAAQPYSYTYPPAQPYPAPPQPATAVPAQPPHPAAPPPATLAAAPPPLSIPSASAEADGVAGESDHMPGAS